VSRHVYRLLFLLLHCCIPFVAAAENAAGQHDMLLLLPDGPVHLRIQISDSGRSLQKMRDDYLAQLVESLDADQNGKLSRSETTKHPLFAKGRRFEGNKFLSSLRSRRPYTDREIAMAVDREAGQLVSYRQNNLLADQDLSVFQVLDADESGLIDRVEMRLAPARIGERDSDFDHCVTFDEFLTVADAMAQPQIVNPLDEEPPGAVNSELLRDATEPILAGRLVRRYDSDRDAHLTADELGWQSQRVESLDTNSDSRLSLQELASLASAEPDISLRVDLGKESAEAMQVIGPSSPDVDVSRADLVRLKRAGLSLSVGYRHRDPMQEAKQNAEAAFNAIDIDANGYLDRDEIAEHQRFERYLFDAMDRDKDDRVFAEEMMTYVNEYTEPASTSCQVTLLDNGNGFFQMLDGNGDGRISIRELRSCERALLDAAADEQQLNPSRLTKSYRIEIQRGGRSLFGRVDRPSAETPAALLKPPSGPIWFQRMDRNGDGDLTWDEFLGPREVFHQLDADQDALIDETEAKTATEEAA
jgi:Ca2+-binding EF-hand superfamily protein